MKEKTSSDNRACLTNTFACLSAVEHGECPWVRMIKTRMTNSVSKLSLTYHANSSIWAPVLLLLLLGFTCIG